MPPRFKQTALESFISEHAPGHRLPTEAFKAAIRESVSSFLSQFTTLENLNFEAQGITWILPAEHSAFCRSSKAKEAHCKELWRIFEEGFAAKKKELTEKKAAEEAAAKEEALRLEAVAQEAAAKEQAARAKAAVREAASWVPQFNQNDLEDFIKEHAARNRRPTEVFKATIRESLSGLLSQFTTLKDLNFEAQGIVWILPAKHSAFCRSSKAIEAHCDELWRIFREGMAEKREELTPQVSEAEAL